MTKQQIKEMMIDIIKQTLVSRANEVLEDIDEDTVQDFMWTINFGEEIAEDYIDTNDIVVDYLEEIYNEITFEDLNAPF